jgi:hypothetical protein
MQSEGGGDQLLDHDFLYVKTAVVEHEEATLTCFKVNIFTDVIIICLPIVMISRLQMKLKQKLGVAGIFCLGFFVVIASSKCLLHSRCNEADGPQSYEPTTPSGTRRC